MTLDNPEVKKRIATWQQELRELTGNEAVLLTSFVVAGKKTTWNEILRACQKVTKVSRKSILGRCRKAPIVQARQLLVYFACHYSGMKHKEIVRKLGQCLDNVRRNNGVVIGLLRAGDPSTCRLAARINAILFPESNNVTNGQAS